MRALTAVSLAGFDTFLDDPLLQARSCVLLDLLVVQLCFSLWRGPRTTHHPHKRPSSSGGIWGGGGWCANCRNPRERQNTHHPQFCTRNVDCPFCGGGAWISRSDLWRETSRTWPSFLITLVA